MTALNENVQETNEQDCEDNGVVIPMNRKRGIKQGVVFFGVFDEKCTLLSQLTTLLEEAVSLPTGITFDFTLARQLERQHDEMWNRHIKLLGNLQDATPFEKEDIYWVLASIDGLTSHIKRFFTILQTLGIPHQDYHLVTMVRRLLAAVKALTNGFHHLKMYPVDAKEDVQLTHTLKDELEELYYQSLARLFNHSEHLRQLASDAPDAAANALRHTYQIFNRYELFHYLFETIHGLDHAANALQTLAVKLELLKKHPE